MRTGRRASVERAQTDEFIKDAAFVMPPSGAGNEAARRKGIPVYSGFVKYFPDAILAVAELSRIGNDQHNPGKPLHWSREKSSDHPDCLLRHMIDDARGIPVDHDHVLHKTKVAWRAMADLQLALEKPKSDSMTLGELVQEKMKQAKADAAPFVGEGLKAPKEDDLDKACGRLVDENSKTQKFAPSEHGLWRSLTTREKALYITTLNLGWKGGIQ